MYNRNITQDCKDANRNMLRQAFNQFLDNIIIDNADRKHGYFSLFACDLSDIDKKIFLSYLTDSDDYIYYTANPIREKEAFKEYESEMQYLIDHRIDDVYFEIQREASGR